LYPGYPAPTPRIKRPWLTSSAVVAIFATMAGLRKALISISVPISTRCVASASAASMVQHSHMPRVGSPGVRSKKLSGSQRLSKPSVSACCAMARIASYERLLLVSRSFARRSVSPIFTNGPQLSSQRRRHGRLHVVRACLLSLVHRIGKDLLLEVPTHLLK